MEVTKVQIGATLDQMHANQKEWWESIPEDARVGIFNWITECHRKPEEFDHCPMGQRHFYFAMMAAQMLRLMYETGK